jgi:hypothetical protein
MYEERGAVGWVHVPENPPLSLCRFKEILREKKRPLFSYMNRNLVNQNVGAGNNKAMGYYTRAWHEFNP